MYKINNKFPPILIYQMGKVGSKTIMRSLEETNIPNFIGHAHSLTWINITQDHYKNIDVSYRRLLRQMIDQYSGFIRFKVISLVRDPVARFISNLFQHYKNYIPNLKNIDEETAIREIIFCLLKNFAEFDEQNDYVCNWFDFHFRDVFTFDVYSVKFNRLNGYQIYSTKFSDILIIRLEDLRRCHQQAFYEFLGLPNFSLFSDNIGAKKWYANLYEKTLSQIRIPEHYLDIIYASRYSQHFYTEKELLSFKMKWINRASKILKSNPFNETVAPENEFCKGTPMYQSIKPNVELKSIKLNDHEGSIQKKNVSKNIRKIYLSNGKQCLFFRTLKDKVNIIEKIKETHPHVVCFNVVTLEATDKLLSTIRPFSQMIIGIINTISFPKISTKEFDIIFTTLPNFIVNFRNAGISTYLLHNSFDENLLFSENKNQKRVYPVSFIGNMNIISEKSKFFFEIISEHISIDFWGNSILTLPDTSALLPKYHGKVSKTERISVLCKSQITINPYIDEYYNKRLFEATGCGTLLITEFQDYLVNLFEIGKEIVVYRNMEECIDLIKYYLNHPNEAQKIAKAGQKRTLKDHTCDIRMKQTAEILERHLRYKKEKDRLSFPKNISTSFKAIHKSQIDVRLTKSWQNETIPSKQRGLTQAELNQMYQGKPPVVYQALSAALFPIIKSDSSILEIGCSTGYYYESLEYLLNMRINYTGGDYSLPMIQMAKDYYPHIPFHVFDGAYLPYPNQSFSIVISSCILLHTPNYQQHIYETARVSNDYLVAHRTPICRKKATSYYTKYAYDVETVELIFNENEFIAEFQKNGFDIKNGVVLLEDVKNDNYNITYIFKRTKKTN
ncbi:MAG: glycosyltransferase [Candidatus Magnetomorum sp.]|nr:glycosyltransferase [Candidatus Magnetomorum sp.]